MSYRIQTRRIRQNEQGYVLLTLLLIIAVMGIVAATMVTDFKFEIQRDREEEMIHRGVMYSRAIRAYYKKFGRYPATIENLENTNQLRFLRKRYKDPVTGKDFKLLHFGEVKMGAFAMMGGGGIISGASTIGANGTLTPNNMPNSFGSNAGAFGQSNQATQKSTDVVQTTDSGTDSQGVSSNTNGAGDQSSSDQPVQTFGGMPIVGVVSTSKETSIREFDQKRKYNDWLFVYDPSLDRGLLITTPYQPRMQMFGVGPQNVNGPPQNQTPGMGTSAPGTVAPTTPPPTSNNNLGNPNQPTDVPVQQ